jgi:uncharacterized membrane protein HdeD (DUF308 family)
LPLVRLTRTPRGGAPNGDDGSTSLTAAAFFFRFWRRTRDLLFLAFAVAFAIEGVNRLAFLFIVAPNEGAPAIYACGCSRTC